MKYADFLHEEIYVIYGDAYTQNKNNMTLCEIIEPDDIEYSARCYKFNKEGKFIFVDEQEILQFIPMKWLESEEHEYFYVVFRYGKTTRSKEHIYMANDFAIKPGDRILTCCDERAGIVLRTGFFKRSNAPFPVEKTWLITRKAYDEININPSDNLTSILNKDNMYLDFINNKVHKGYIAKAESTYRGFVEWYIEDVDRVMSNATHKVTATTILNYLSEEFEGGFNYRDCGYEGDFLSRYNQIYNFFDAVWLCYVLSKYDCIDTLVVDAFRYMLIIYQNGDFDEYLYNLELDKVHIDEHIKFIEKHLK